MSKTDQKIANLLNRDAMTVEALSRELGLSRNSVHLQVNKLEAAGVLEKHVVPSTTKGAGKPASSYRVIPEQEDAFSNAHKAVLRGLVKTLADTMSDPERKLLLEQAGRTIARSAGLVPSGNLDDDIKKSVEIVNKLGAGAQILQRANRSVISCHSCPIASSIHADKQLCSLVAGLFSEGTGARVTIECTRERTVVCGFSFGRR